MALDDQRFPVLRRSLLLITLGGCLAMVYSACVSSPVTMAFLRELGARESHIGIMSGVGMWMLSLNFVGAIVTSRLRKRKPLFLVSLIGSRLVYILIAFLPMLLPDLDRAKLLWVIIPMIIMVNAVGTLIGPLWLSWMGDLIPRRVLNTYWGTRQGWLHFFWAISYLGVALFAWLMNTSAERMFPILAVAGVIAGIIDILLFIWVEEPANTLTPQGEMLKAILAPLRDKGFRRFLTYKCAWQGFAMFGAVFMQFYVLKKLEIEAWKVTLIWCAPGFGMFVSSRWWGRIADRYGQRPVIILCTSLKSLILVAFLLVTRSTATWLLPPVFFFDSILNSGMLLASNGYMIKAAPKENRSMFIAATTALAGLVGGLGAMAGGWFLEAYNTWSWTFAGRTWNNYQLLFAIDVPLRLLCAFIAVTIHEPASSSPLQVFQYIRGTMRLSGTLVASFFYRKGEDEDGKGSTPAG